MAETLDRVMAEVVEEADVEDAVVDEEEAVVEEEGTVVTVGTSGEVGTDMIAEEEEEAGATLTETTTAAEAEEEIVDLFRVAAGEEISIAHQGPSKVIMTGNVIF